MIRNLILNGKNGNYRLVMDKVLGQGSYGKVYQGIELSSGVCSAIKILDIPQSILNEKSKAEIERETKNIKEISSEYIVSLRDEGLIKDNKFFVFEYCETDLEKLKKSTDYNKVFVNGVFDENHKKNIMRLTNQLLNGFKVIFSKNLIHRDIKPANLLISKGVLKIADFGFSRIIDDMLTAADYTRKGTPFYCCYEILKGEKFSSKCDVYSCGVVIYEILFGVHPYLKDGRGVSSMSQILSLMKDENLVIPPNNMPVPYIELLKGMVRIKEEMRLDWEEIFLKMETMFEKEPETETIEEDICDGISDSKKTPILKLIEKNLLNLIIGNDIKELLEKRMQINSFYQKLILSLLEVDSFFTLLIKNQLILCLNIIYRNNLENDKKFIEKLKSLDIDKKYTFFMDKINKDDKDCKIVIEDLKIKICQEIKSHKKKSSANRYFEFLLQQNSIETQPYEQFISWIIQSQKKLLIDKITNDNLKIKDAFLFFHLIHSIDHMHIFNKPLTTNDKFYDPVHFRNSVNELTRENLYCFLEIWLKA